MRISPTRSPAKSTPKKESRPKRSPFGSPGSRLEDDNFEDSFDGNVGVTGATLDFSKRHRFVQEPLTLRSHKILEGLWRDVYHLQSCRRMTTRME